MSEKLEKLKKDLKRSCEGHVEEGPYSINCEMENGSISISKKFPRVRVTRNRDSLDIKVPKGELTITRSYPAGSLEISTPEIPTLATIKQKDKKIGRILLDDTKKPEIHARF